MIKKILFWSFLGLGLSSKSLAAGVPQACLAGVQSYVQAKKNIGVPEKHLPRLFIADEPRSDYVIVFIHGLFESPNFFKALNLNFAANHFNSLSILLPGHWEQDLKALDHVTSDEWVRELDNAVKMAHCFAPHVILAGHSLGGLIEVNKILRDPNEISGLILLAPALKLSWLAAAGAEVGTYLGLNGNIFLRTHPDHDEVPYISARATDQLYNLIDKMAKTYSLNFDSHLSAKNDDYSLSQLHIYQRIHAPVFVAYAESEPAVSDHEIELFLEQTQGPKASLYFAKATGVWHGNIGKGPIDTYKRAPDDYNHAFELMTSEINQFLKSNFN